MKDILIVDGYNMIGDWEELKQLKDNHQLIDARDRLIELLAEFQAYSQYTIIVVFDAYQVPGIATKEKQHAIDIIYTRVKETADECIEALTMDKIHKYGRLTRITVATSDMAEQSVIFGNGALRMPASELHTAVREAKRQITHTVKKEYARETKFSNRVQVDDETKSKLENMRRGLK
ncbi:NYN domain-containing protein [Kurthia massiliensis]|uniref:NYN domain-containing protein n=1 Tax=Kurthia massiliensis TaxID=1033739 RepID=UPI000288CCBF|nr:NYN domain-containing protein [Kurthia massiliensis]